MARASVLLCRTEFLHLNVIAAIPVGECARAEHNGCASSARVQISFNGATDVFRRYAEHLLAQITKEVSITP